jgi:hypothetical protein
VGADGLVHHGERVSGEAVPIRKRGQQHLGYVTDSSEKARTQRSISADLGDEKRERK